MIAKNQTKVDPPPPIADTPSADTPLESTKNVLTTTQWLSVISIVVSLAGIYYKRKEIKGLLTKKTSPLTPPPVPPNTPVDFVPRRGIQLMDSTFKYIDIPCKELMPFRLSSKRLPSGELLFSGLTSQLSL